MQVDLLVTTYQRPHDIGLLVRNLEGQSFQDFQLQIFDGSPDDLVKEAVFSYLETNRKLKYPIIYHRTSSGMTKQRNIAVDATSGDISIFLDDDVELDPEYLKQVVKVFQQDRSQIIAGLNGFDTRAPSELGIRKKIFRFLGLLPEIGNARYLPWGHGTPHWENGLFQGIRECDLLIGHNMAWRTSVLKKFRFDTFFEKYPTYVLYDDQEICHRIRKEFKLVQCGDAKLSHNLSKDGRPAVTHYGFQALFNAYWNWKRHVIEPSITHQFKFWLWEFLDILFQLFKKRTRAISLGRLEALEAIMLGYKNYEDWVNKKTQQKWGSLK